MKIGVNSSFSKKLKVELKNNKIQRWEKRI